MEAELFLFVALEVGESVRNESYGDQKFLQVEEEVFGSVDPLGVMDELLFVELDDFGEEWDLVEIGQLFESLISDRRGEDFSLFGEIPQGAVDVHVMDMEGVPGDEVVEIAGVALAKRDRFASFEVDQRII